MKGRAAIVLVAALAAAAGTARLGLWQLDRAAQKIALQQALQTQRALPPLPGQALARDAATAAGQLHRAITLQGEWLAQHTVYLENRQMRGQPGFYVLTPLRLADASVVLVQRGWAPRDLLDRTRIAAPPPPAGTVLVQGRIAPGPARLYDFEGAASGPIRQNLDLAVFARETGLPLRPLMVVQEAGGDGPPGGLQRGTEGGPRGGSRAGPDDGLLREWPAPAADVQKHYGYAFQWFAFSALIIGLYVWFQLIRPRRARRA